jgi:hypothetical protein
LSDFDSVGTAKAEHATTLDVLVNTIPRVFLPGIGIRVAISKSYQGREVNLSNTSVDGLESIVGGGVEKLTSANTAIGDSTQLSRAIGIPVAVVGTFARGRARKVISSGAQIDDGGGSALITVSKSPLLEKDSSVTNRDGGITVFTKDNSSIFSRKRRSSDRVSQLSLENGSSGDAVTSI